MTRHLIPVVALLACHQAMPVRGVAQTTSPKAAPASLSFTYQINGATLPAAQAVQVTVPAALADQILSVTVSPIGGWLTVTPDSGRAPLALTVNVNPTTLNPGSYSGQIVLTATGASPVTVPVALSITTPPATLSVSCSASNYTESPPALAFTYTTGGSGVSPATSLLSVASSSDTIPFTVTVSAGTGAGGSWARVNGANQTPSAKTSGVAFSGSSVPITVSLDAVTVAALNPGSYSKSITIAGNNTANGSATIAVTLVVSAGPPVMSYIFPSAVVAGPLVNPVITVTGDNFFSTSVVTLTPNPATAPAVTLSSTLLSRKVLRAVVPATLLAAPGSWTVAVANPAPASNPSQAPVTASFSVTSATTPVITSIVNAASYLTTSSHTGTSANPVPTGGFSVAPREIISVFGQNLGPVKAVVNTPSGTPSVLSSAALSGIQLSFTAGSNTYYAPLIMVSSNQVNAVVPAEVGTAAGTPPQVSVILINSSGGSPVSTAPVTATVVAADPGLFTFGGLGKGQGAVLNYDAATGSVVVNSSKDAAARGSTIEIFVTGMGDYSSSTPLANGELPASAIALASTSTRVEIDGQPAVVTYAGASPGSVAGLVQINAIVPPTVKTGAAVPITVSLGSAASSRRSQTQVTLGVK